MELKDRIGITVLFVTLVVLLLVTLVTGYYRTYQKQQNRLGFSHKLSRFGNKLYARINGYFWLPCPKCGELFGGHELGMQIIPKTFDVNGRMITGTGCCKFCDKE